ncbi:tryptophan 7-halogenase [Acidovorax sp. GBBC 3334]|uniref:flavin-dependent monooxygenase QhpG n=1 Tax=Acidovorax sp. GBBC 3334 TaxID=2940496 RepID=UPI0023044E80|nr:tryptophan 7-halogenase [Acidovorax sp. GBBC 3334]MDA8456227.1 tryptophan 7-halogenase [Acidovorax sp. GBBC 3334]
MADLDCLVIGAGPAGNCAALRLLQWGYRVGVVERAAFPRAQIGEALTPGIRNILGLLQADEALAGLPHIAGRPGWLRWEQDTLLPVPQAGTALVERADFDARLLALAAARGARVWQPAQVQAVEGEPEAWRLQIVEPATGTVSHVAARWLFEASGRHGAPATRWACAPPLAALWAEFDAAQVDPAYLAATRVEALPNAWLWAAPLPSGRLRAMVFADPHAVGGQPQALWRDALASTHGLQALAGVAPAQPLRICSAAPYLDTAAWRAGRVKIGDAAFALDPLSGSGVEKAMRFSLQAAVSWHTWSSAADDAGRSLARQYFAQQLNQTCARHVGWCAGHYARAWSADGDFWRARSAPPRPRAPSIAPQMAPASAEPADDFFAALAEAPPPDPLPAGPDRWPATARVRLDEACRLASQLCVVDDRVRSAPALSHPRLPRAVAFVADQALAPLWPLLRREQTMAELHAALAQAMRPDAAGAVLAWLRRSGVLVPAA